METKICTWCKRMLSLSDFGNHRLGKDGLNYWCKECVRDKSRVWAHTPSGMYSAIKSRQTFYQKNMPYRHKPVNISREEFISWYKAQPKHCVYCGLTEDGLSKVDDFYNNKGAKLSVDAKVNALGYIRGNLVLSCHRCQGIKSDFFTYEEMLEIGQSFVRERWEVYTVNIGFG